MSEIFASESFQHAGTEYTLKPLGYEDRGRFCVWVEKEAIDHVRRHKADYGDDYQAVLGQLKRVRWGSKEWIEVLATVEGTQEMAYLMLKGSHPEITRAQVAAFWPEPDMPIVDYDNLGSQIAAKIERLLTRPNSPRPASPGAP